MKLKHTIKNLARSLSFKLVLIVGFTLLLSIAIWAYFNVKYQKEKVLAHIVADADRLSNTIKLGTHYAMMLNAKSDIRQIIQNISRQDEVKNIRIFNKKGEITYSNSHAETGATADIQSRRCSICHLKKLLPIEIKLSERSWISTSPEGYRRIEVISPILNEPGCSTSGCHVHPGGTEVLGILNVVVSMAEYDRAIFRFEKGIVALAAFNFFVPSVIIFIFIMKFVTLPIKKLIIGTHRIARGNYSAAVEIEKADEIGQLAGAINQMGKEIGEKQAELNRQRNEYQNLFEQVPCLITVQDKNYRLIGFNREFSEKFGPKLGDYCYQAYKGRDKKCETCPVEKTFKDGQSHFCEETGTSKDGTVTNWIVRTSAIRNVDNEIVAAMEMSLDITHRRQLEEKLQKSEKKYQEIFNNIPNPAFVLSKATLEILDCNLSVKPVYGYVKRDIVHKSFLTLFNEDEKEALASQIRTKTVIHRVRHLTKDQRRIYVDIWVSPSDYNGQSVLLVTTSDITQRLEAEQQLIQTGKMATLGEMATGVAHELNQPLSVIKTASSFCMKKANRKEKIQDTTLFTMLSKIDSNVDRATRIITHMRQFARKDDLKLVKIQLNNVLERAFEIFSQQLKLRGIEVVWDIDPGLPQIKGDADRLEQVLINLLVNARDAIEEKGGPGGRHEGDKKITIKTGIIDHNTFVEVCDTGPGIPDAVRDKIFEPFFTTKAVGKGTGLGLSISYGIVKDCGGSIQVKSTSPEGTCFILKFPLEEKE